jgi:hypothetical protein
METNEEQYTIDTTPFRVKVDEPAPGPSGDRLRKYNALKLNIDTYKTMWGSEYDDGAVQVETLLSQSNKKVWAVCIQCGKGRWVQYWAYCHLCNTCSHSGDRCSEETRKKMSAAKSGENNHMFGKHHSEESRIKTSCTMQEITSEEFSGFYGKYCPKFNEGLKERIREKYGRKCLLCPTTEEENIAKNDRKLSIHHVDYNKQCGCDGNECRLVPLCDSCHSKTNKGRSRWEQVIMLKIVELFPDINFDSPQTSLEYFYTTEKSEHEFKISKLVKSIVKSCVTYPPDPHSMGQSSLFDF